MSIDDMKRFQAVLSSHQYRVTHARETTFKLLLNPDPQSMRELIHKANGEVDRVSIYRSVELFEKLGIVHRIYVGWKYKLELSDEFIAHHHHLACLTCGKVIDIQDEKHIDEFIDMISKQFNFTARRHQFEIDGYCENCSKQRDPGIAKAA